MALQRRTAAAAGGRSAEASDPDVGKWAPTIVEFLTSEKWPDGAVRKTGTIMVLAEDGLFKAWVHDRDGACACWVSGGTLADLMDAIEGSLSDGTTNWRKDGGKPRK